MWAVQLGCVRVRMQSRKFAAWRSSTFVPRAAMLAGGGVPTYLGFLDGLLELTPIGVGLVVFGIAYLTVHEGRGQGRVNWDWLRQQPELGSALDGVIRHVRLQQPAEVLVDGNTGRGAILPGTFD